ncbi:hypothetical protein CANCADRAFT_93497 [Tortispora caseinolytica NRRL Y-17796]|uniref:3-isopropylmalate dehydrogenase n=1 Tax=Tortispora caseinolytica NRRL Y-17796 TaxID=767744 RepID=A0A1E4TM50_9ASCO|nr:hypothetical protein CANCADRAFT_93497 [Tortispora caseinolytica NRRL Y-17796]
MTEYNILVLEGDHVGPEIMAEALKVLNTIQEARPDVKFNFKKMLCGGCAIDATGEPCPDETLEAAKKSDAVLFAAVGGPKWGAGLVRPEAGLLRLRKELNLYANLRPCKFISESLADLSPLRPEIVKGTDIMVLRELTGGIYFGEHKEDNGDGIASDLEIYSKPEIERITRMAGYLARQSNPPSKVTSLDKANVMASGRLWRKTVTETLDKEFPDIKYEHQLMDSAAMILIKAPTSLNGVIVCSNIFGDIISDESSVIPGSLGLLPSASLASLPDNNRAIGLYEPCHGSAPDLPPNRVNPIAMILSAAMMLRLSLAMPKEADAVEAAVKKVVDSKDIGGLEIRTGDLRGNATTTEMGDAIVSVLKTLL